MQISSNIPAQSSPRHVFVVSMRSDLPSLTPRFSEVPVRLKAANRFSDFSGAGKKTTEAVIHACVGVSYSAKAGC
jgi:hypothetical protein